MRLLSRKSTAHSPGVRSTPGVAVIAHRGASATAPENTLAAVRAAVAAGADHVEVDVQRTGDGALVVAHDTGLGRTTDAARVFAGRGPWRLADLSYAEVRRLDAGAWHGPSYAGERVPTLREVVDVLAGTGTGLLLEVKAPQLYPGIAGDVAAELRAAPGYVDSEVAAGRLVVQSFDHGVMRTFKDLEPSVPVGLLGTPPRRRLPRLATWADQVNPRHSVATPGYVAAAHEVGLRCQVWTVDDPADMTRALALGVDGIITNRPGVLRDLLADREPGRARTPALVATGAA